jgi:GNAT superfamily N-acetyltransferase
MALALHGPLADVQACEERLMNAWPSHQTLVAGDWLCRFASGYSGRANSACAVRPGAALDVAMLDHVEALYGAAGLRTSFRLSPLVGEAARILLEARGYAPEDGSIGMIGQAFAADCPSGLRLEPAPMPEWIAGACRWQAGAKRDTDALRGIVANIRLPTRFATLHHAGAPAAYGLISLDRGMAEFGAVIVDPAQRGRGLGRALVAGMIGWAAEAGAARIFLQVAEENAAARGLYESLGFRLLYAAAYWRRSA